MKTFLAFTSIWIAIAAYLLGVATLSHFTISNLWLHPTATLLLGSTLIIYPLHNIYKNQQRINTPRNTWNALHIPTLKIAVLVGILILGYSLTQLAIKYWLYYLLVFIATLLYSYPIIAIGNKHKSFKSFGYLKPFYIATVWWLCTYLFPVLVIENNITTDATIDGIYRYLILVLICIIFDQKDQAADLEKGIITLAQRFQNKLPIIINFSCYSIIIFTAILYFFHSNNLLILIILYTFYLKKIIKKSTKTTDELFYVWQVDGLLFSYGILLIFYNLIIK